MKKQPRREWKDVIDIEGKDVQRLTVVLTGKKGLFKNERKEFDYTTNGCNIKVTLETT